MASKKFRCCTMAESVCHRALVYSHSLNRHSGDSKSFFDFMESVIEELVSHNQVGTATNYRATLRSFRRFRRDADVTLRQIDRVLINEYQTFLTSAGLTRNSISFYIRILRAVYNRAVFSGLISDRRPFIGSFTGTEKTCKRAISSKDISRIHKLNLTQNPDLEFARDIFLFLFFCRGMSFVDAAYLRITDIIDNHLTYRRRKTGQQLQIKIIPQISTLLKKYRDRCQTPFLLPIITTPGTDERRQYETALRRVNRALKTIGKMAKLSVNLSTYVGRHSWATIAKTKNVPVNVISDALGHDSPATTRIYLDSIDTSIIDRANDIVIRNI